MKALLHWFWTPVRENENWAQTLVRVGGNLFRSLLTLVVLGGLAIAASMRLNQEAQEEITDQRERISVTANTDATNPYYQCNEEYPVSIAVVNNSNQTLMGMDIDISARTRSTSTNILPYSNRTLRWDHIVPPQHALAMCYRLGDAIAPGIVVTASAQLYSIELRRTEDWMLSETSASVLAPTCTNGSANCPPWERDWSDSAPSEGVHVTDDSKMLLEAP
ncbi:hypothetical protein [Vitreimonas sp.]|uniref:hypothetical protein n=1 Tax=Vitreimonas sp. TaxID=3069702 RepID=UPI002EDAEF34